jgi:BolA protein
MRASLQRSLDVQHLEVINESHAHAVPMGAETHFKVVVVSPAFVGLLPVKRHQVVYRALGEELRSGLHALTITARTPEEWAADPSALESPACRGGSNAEKHTKPSA